MVHRPIHVQLSRLINTGSSMHRLSVLLPAVETSLRTCTAHETAQWVLVGIISTHIPVPRVLAVDTIEGGIYFARTSRLCGYCSRAATIQGWRQIKGIWYMLFSNYLVTIPFINITTLSLHFTGLCLGKGELGGGEAFCQNLSSPHKYLTTNTNVVTRFHRGKLPRFSIKWVGSRHLCRGGVDS